MTIRRFLIVLPLLGVLVPLPAFAQMVPSRVVSSVDAKAWSRETVAVGRISDFIPNQDFSTDVTILVDEVLKGRAQTTLKTRLRPYRSAAMDLSRLSSSRTPVLVAGDDILPLSRQGLAVPTASGLLLRDPAKVLEYLRETLRGRGPVAAGAFQIPLPTQFQNVELSVFFDSRGAPPPKLAVPIDARLEQWAIEAIRSNSDRLTGFQALRWFTSDFNVAFVKTYLHDPAFEPWPAANNNNGIEVRDYRVRRAAYDLLRTWRVAVEQPLLREEVPRFDAVKSFRWSDSTAHLLWPKVLALSKNLQRFEAPMIGRPSPQEFSRIVEVQTLTRVSLTARDKGDEWLVPVTQLRNLEELELRNSNVTDQGLGLLTVLRNLRLIILSETRVTDDGLRALAGIESLKRIIVFYAPHVTPAGIAELRARRSDIQVTWQRTENVRGRNIHEAAQVGDLENVRRLAQDTSDGVRRVNLVGTWGSSPLMFAVGQNHVNVARLLLDEGANVNARDRWGATPLLWAARHGYPDMVQLLLDRQAIVNLRDSDGNNALHFAVQKGLAEIARMLVERGADIQSRNTTGETPLDLADRLGNPQVQDVLRSAAAAGRGR